MDDDDLLAEQRAFYRARAPEYDEWWRREGRYDRGAGQAREWHDQVVTVEAALAAFGATGARVGAGGRDRLVDRTAGRDGGASHRGRFLARDACPQPRTVARADVEYVVDDLFEWRPARQYDVVFFSFWLSHVPRARFAAFWMLVRACLAPGGRVFLIDNRPDPEPRANVKDPYVVEYGPDLHLRRLSDGSEFRVVKVMYEPDELQSLIEAEGWHADIGATRWFLFGSCETA